MKARLPSRVTVAVVLLAAAAAAGILLVRFLQSPRGDVLLLDVGLADRYEAAQAAIDAELRGALDGLGLGRGFKESEAPVIVGSRRVSCREWRVEAAGSQSLVRVNLALTDAVHRAGGVVRTCRESPGEAALALEVGSRRHATHRIVVHRGRLAPGRARREAPGGEERSEGERLAPGAGTEVERELEAPRASPCRVALVIDDFGYSRGRIAEEFLDLDMPLTVSVIPTLAYSRYVLTRAAQAGHQTLLHLPMEAESFASDVPPVLTSMRREEIVSLVETYLDETPGVVGVNNHLGSVATRDERVMDAVIGVIARRNLFFFDSLTSSRSIAYNTAVRFRVPSARNDLFVDADTEDERVVAERLDHLLEIAKKRGSAVGIGHPRPWTLNAVRAWRERARAAGVEFVFLSAVVR